jgi:peptidoglycan/xylan/chitin deacetylase (PgdA/CDA1 family)
LAVLFYHRVADDLATPWTISNRMFARQIEWLRSRFELVSLDEVQRRVRRGANHRPAVSITFDDGYSENCREAIPLLVKEQIPCTYFVTLRNVLEGEPFSHDLILGHSFAPNTTEQVRAMAGAGIEIGAHTYAHADLGSITDRRLLRLEIVEAGEAIAHLVGRPVRYFAFPYGSRASLSREAFQMAREAGYKAACSAYGGFNFPGDDAFHIQRIPADQQMLRLKNWLTFDPRKLWVQRFTYGDLRNSRIAQVNDKARMTNGERMSKVK